MGLNSQKKKKESLGDEKQTMLDNSLGNLFIDCPWGEDQREKHKGERTRHRSPPSMTVVV